VEEVLIARGSGARWFEEVKALAQKHGVRFRLVEPARLQRLAGTVNHQGIAARTFGYHYCPETELWERLGQAGQSALAVVADCLQDPMNLGNLIRTAQAMGAQGVILPKNRAVGVTSAVAKAAAGALAHIPVCRVTNLAEAIFRLKDLGLWVIGAEAAAPKHLYAADLTGPVALVIGGEGQGLRPRVERACDLVLAIPMTSGKITSLNAATAGAVFLYEILRQRILAGHLPG
jgi:23S rRNA (guanosine2251-2'-O)-methyltransferase